jgi:8-oxo-dGTP pyrophosphatase MutT (NUDIX family)
MTTSKPFPERAPGPPVQPRDAASLMLLREKGSQIEILMGQRHTKSPFMPDIYVFPGGKIEADDWLIAPSQSLGNDVSKALQATAKCSSEKATALANAAIRETYEEVGLKLGSKTKPSDVPTSWREFASEGLAPNHGVLRMIGRAITPTASPQRFHARFLAAKADHASGELRESHELSDLGFRTIDEALALPIIDVTEEMLKRVRTLGHDGLDFLEGSQSQIVFASYRSHALRVRYL